MEKCKGSANKNYGEMREKAAWVMSADIVCFSPGAIFAVTHDIMPGHDLTWGVKVVGKTELKNRVNERKMGERGLLYA